jgi:hypothetical protein
MSHATTPPAGGIAREVDPYGRVVFDDRDAFELLYRGLDIPNLLIREGDDLKKYNEWCRAFDKMEHEVHAEVPLGWSPDDEHLRRTNQWMIPSPFDTMDVRAELLSRCATDEQMARVEMELRMFEKRGLVPVLRLMFALVDHFRRNKVVWGVGRGSSVASYVLFLIGVHRIDSLRYGLDINEFLKPLHGPEQPDAEQA